MACSNSSPAGVCKRSASGVIDVTGVVRVGKGQSEGDCWRTASSRHVV